MRHVPALGLALAVALGPAVSSAQVFQPTFFGGAGDQKGTSIAISNGALHVAGYQASGPQAIVARYAVPPAAPAWSYTGVGGTYSLGLAVQETNVFAVGAAVPPACGASDGVGGTEAKVGLLSLQTDGTGAACQSANYFSYRGGENYAGAVTQDEAGTPYLYAIGSAENCGFGHTLHVLAKYTMAGTRSNWVTEQPSPGCIGGSYGNGIASLGGYLYVAAHSALTGLGEDGVARPVLMKYDSTLSRVWKRRTATVVGVNSAVAPVDGFLYTAGYTFVNGVPNTEDYLVQKYDADGNLAWSRTSGGSATDVLTGIVGLRGRVFAVGYTKSEGSGGFDAVLLEIDPATGDTRKTSLWGGAQDDMANGVTTDGTDLYAVGESKSFATPEGNVVGQNDLVVLRITPGDYLYTAAPCRVVDTRGPDGPTGGPALSSGSTRLFPVTGGTCAIPATARAVAVNVTAVGPTDRGNLRLYPAGEAEPTASSLNFSPGTTRANNAVVRLGTGGQVAVKCVMASPGTVHFVLDVTGYFE